MADTTPHWTWRLLALAWAFTVSVAAAFGWQTTSIYVRQNLQPLPGEADLTIRECQALPDCANNARDTVTEQLALLRQTRALIHLSAWAVVVLAALVLATATLLLLRRRHNAAVRTLRAAWKAQVVLASLLLLAQGAMLATGAGKLAAIAEPARVFTSTKAFDQPFTDIGHLYYLFWFIAVSAATIVLTWAIQRSLQQASRTAEKP